MTQSQTSAFSKEDHEHKLALIRILVEKGLLGLVVASLALYASKSVESFKNDLTKQQFMLQKRLEGVQALGDKYSPLKDLARECGRANEAGGPVPQELLKRYDTAINEFMREQNRWTVIFHPSFDAVSTNHIWIHDGIATHKEIHFTREHWPFMTDVFDNFQSALRNAFEVGPASSEGFQFRALSDAEREMMTGGEYFSIQYEEWEKVRGKNAPHVD